MLALIPADQGGPLLLPYPEHFLGSNPEVALLAHTASAGGFGDPENSPRRIFGVAFVNYRTMVNLKPVIFTLN